MWSVTQPQLIRQMCGLAHSWVNLPDINVRSLLLTLLDGFDDRFNVSLLCQSYEHKHTKSVHGERNPK